MPSPVLTARWTELLMLNFPIPVEAVASIAPPGTEPDLHDGQTYLSVIGFRFHAVRLYGLAIPGHTSFSEINLRYYVRRRVGSETRRGVVFVREIVPRRAVAIIANRVYHENYITRPMRTTLQIAGDSLAPGDTLEYAWRSRRRGLAPFAESSEQKVPGTIRSGMVPLSAGWNRLAARVAAPLALPAAGSLEEFIVEHYWGYAAGRDGSTREYQVAHVPWQVAPADNVIWDCDLLDYSTPGRRGRAIPSLVEYLKQSPASAIVANGSPIQVFRGNRLT